MENVVEELKDDFPNYPEDYYQTVVDRFEENQRIFEINERVLNEVFWEKNDVVVGERYRFEDGLYEVTLINREPMDEKPTCTIAKVLDTKVSESYKNKMVVSFSTLKECPAFEDYNQMVRWINENVG